jgi:hypothetical protein
MFKKLFLSSLFLLLTTSAFAGGEGKKVRDPILDFARGETRGFTCVNKFGRNSTVASGGTEEIWDGSAAYSFPATALMTSISQTTDQAAMRGENVEIQGLDANWDLVVQTATLDATLTTNVVTLTTPLIRVFRASVQANVVTTSNIRIHNAGETQDYAVIGTGNNQTLMAIYTVPNGKTAYMTNYYAQVNPGGGAPTTLNIKMWARDNENGYEKQIKHVLGLNGDIDTFSHFQHLFIPHKVFTEKTDIYLEATTAAAAADVSAGFDLILIDN